MFLGINAIQGLLSSAGLLLNVLKTELENKLRVGGLLNDYEK